MPSRLTIDLSALGHNYRQIAADAPGAEVAAVVKADGYGLGAGEISRRLHDEGARSFFVARLEEGEALRKAMGQRECAIYVLDGLLPGTDGRLTAANLTPVINAPEQAVAWGARPCALHINTGMNRLGVTVDEAAALALGGFAPTLVMSHLGCGDDPASARNEDQLARFRAVRALFPDARGSLAASSGVYLAPDYHFDMVRPGISLYGGGPREVPDPRFRAVATLEAPVLQVNELKAGERAGYGAMFTAPRDMRLAIVGAGYADGILRSGFRGAYGWVNGAKAPLAIVTMDMIGLDVSDIAVKPGDTAELLGENAKLDDLARAAGSVAHECLVRLGGRSEKVYLGAR